MNCLGLLNYFVGSGLTGLMYINPLATHQKEREQTKIYAKTYQCAIPRPPRFIILSIMFPIQSITLLILSWSKFLPK